MNLETDLSQLDSAGPAAGHALLVSHRQFLRREFHALRHRSYLSQVVRAVRTVINEKPGVVLCVVAILVLAACIWLQLRTIP